MSTIVTLDMLTQLAQIMASKGFDVKPIDYVYALSARILGYIQSYEDSQLTAAASKDLLSSRDFIPVLKRSILRVEISVSFSGVAPKFHKITKNGPKNIDSEPLAGAALTSGVAQSFDTNVKLGERINFQIDQAGTVDYIKILEIPPDS